MKKEYGLITGASGLLGMEHALALLEIGINPILTDINIKKLRNQTSILKKKYPKSEIIFYKMNVTNENSVKKIKNKITSKKNQLKF